MRLDRHDIGFAGIDSIKSQQRSGGWKSRRPIKIVVLRQRFLEILCRFALSPSVHIANQNRWPGIELGMFKQLLNLSVTRSVDEREMGRHDAQTSGGGLESRGESHATFDPRIGNIENRYGGDWIPRENRIAQLTSTMTSRRSKSQMEAQPIAQRIKGVWSIRRSEHFLEGNHVRCNFGNHRRRPGGVGARPAVETRPAVHVVARDRNFPAHSTLPHRQNGGPNQGQMRH